MKTKEDISTSKYIQRYGLMYFKYKKDTTKLIVTSAKCGTRYFTELAQYNTDFVRFHPSLDTMEANDKYFDELSEIYWIVRPPMEHAISAIMTEHSSNMDNLTNPNQTSSKLKIKKQDDDWKLNVLETLLKDILTEPQFTINSGDGIDGVFSHYKPRYEDIYNDIPNRLHLFSKIKFIELKNLSDLIQNEFNITDNFKSKEYGMDRFFTKDSLVQAIKTNFPDMWEKLRGIINVEEHYYNIVLNYNYHTAFTRKIKESHTEIDEVYERLNTELQSAYEKHAKYIETYLKYKGKNVSQKYI